MTDSDFTQPHGAPDQKARVLEWLREGKGLTQLEALQHLAVQRLAAIVFRLKEDDGHPIVTELIEVPTRYGPARCARYTLAPALTHSMQVRLPTAAEPPTFENTGVLELRIGDRLVYEKPCPVKLYEAHPMPQGQVDGPCQCERPCPSGGEMAGAYVPPGVGPDDWHQPDWTGRSLVDTDAIRRELFGGDVEE